jgi:hypothetical protein
MVYLTPERKQIKIEGKLEARESDSAELMLLYFDEYLF